MPRLKPNPVGAPKLSEERVRIKQAQLRLILASLGMGQSELARELGLGYHYVADWLRSDRHPNSLSQKHYAALCAHLDDRGAKGVDRKLRA